MAEKDHPSVPEQGQALQTYILTPVESAETSREPLLSPSRLVFALWRWKWLILLAPVILGVALYLFRSSQRDRYVSTATLLVQNSPITNELDPQSLGIETYQNLLTSDAVLIKLKKRLLESSLIPASTTIEDLRSRVDVELVANKAVDRAGQRSYLPMLRLVATFRTPEMAERTANIWADLFVEESRNLSRLRKNDALDYVEARFPDVSNTLSTTEEKLNKTKDAHSTKLLKTRKKWQDSILKTRLDQARKEETLRADIIRSEREFEQETDKLITDFKLETEHSKRDLLNTWQRDLKEDELSIKRSKLTEFKDRLLDIQVKIEENREHLRELQTEIAKHPEFLVLSKAISDDALWQRVAESSKDKNLNLRDLADLKFETQSLNPVYQRLLGELTTAKVELNTLVPNESHLRENIASLEKELRALDDSFSSQQLEYDALVARRETQLENLRRERQTELNILRQKNQAAMHELSEKGTTVLAQLEETQDNELENLGREGDLSIAQLTREADNAKQTYDMIAAKLEAARLARNDELADVQLGIPAVRPEKPTPKDALLWAAGGLFVGFFTVLTLVILFEVGRMYFPEESGTSSPRTQLSKRSERGAGIVSRELPSSGRS